MSPGADDIRTREGSKLARSSINDQETQKPIFFSLMLSF